MIFVIVVVVIGIVIDVNVIVIIIVVIVVVIPALTNDYIGNAVLETLKRSIRHWGQQLLPQSNDRSSTQKAHPEELLVGIRVKICVDSEPGINT